MSPPVLPPIPPSLVAPRFLEVGSERPVSCTLDGLFPAPEAGVYLSLGDQSLHPDVTLDGDNLVATATATPSAEQEGITQLMCSVTLGGESRETQENLTVYSKENRGWASTAGSGTRVSGRQSLKVGGTSTPELAGRERSRAGAVGS